MKTAAFFDIDRTIARGNSSKNILKYYWHKLHFFFVLNVVFVFVLKKMNIISSGTLIRTGAKFFKGKGKKEVEKEIKKAFDDKLKKSIYEDMKKVIKKHKSKNHRTIIITNQFDVIAEPFKKYLRIDHALTSDLEFVKGKYTGKLVGEPCSGENKAKRAKEIAKKLNIDMKKSYFYTDSISDISLLEAVGNPVAVNPDRKLIKAAGKNIWKVLLVKR